MEKTKKICILLEEKKLPEAKDIITREFKNDLIQYNYYMGLYYSSKYNFRKANNYYKNAESQGLRNFIFYYNYALTYLELKNNGKAKELLNKSIELNKFFKPSYLNLSYILEQEGNIRECYRVIKRCLCFINDKDLVAYEKALLNRINH